MKTISKTLLGAALAAIATAAQAQTKLNIGYATATDFLPAFIAKDEGCFDKHKIDATLTRMPIVGNIPGALMSNSLQIGMSTPTVLLQAKEGGLDLVAVAGATRMLKANPNISLVARKEVTIKTAADVKGKKIGVPGVNSVADVMFRKWLKNNNVKLEDVTFIETPFHRCRTCSRAAPSTQWWPWNRSVRALSAAISVIGFRKNSTSPSIRTRCWRSGSQPPTGPRAMPKR